MKSYSDTFSANTAFQVVSSHKNKQDDVNIHHLERACNRAARYGAPQIKVVYTENEGRLLFSLTLNRKEVGSIWGKLYPIYEVHEISPESLVLKSIKTGDKALLNSILSAIKEVDYKGTNEVTLEYQGYDTDDWEQIDAK